MNDWAHYLPTDVNYNVPLNCRPNFKDLVSLPGGVVLPKFASNPAGYQAAVGSIYFNTTDNTLYYRTTTGYNALGVSGTPAPAVFPIQATSALDSDVIISSLVTPDLNPTWQLTADGTQIYTSGSGLLLGQLRYDTLQDRLTWEDTAGSQNGKFATGTIWTSSLSTPLITTTGSIIGFDSKSINTINDVGAVTGTFSTSISAPTLTAATSISTPVITTTGSGISFSTKSLTSVNEIVAVIGTYSNSVTAPTFTAATYISTPTITTSGTGISFSTKSLTSVNDIAAITGTFSTSLNTATFTATTANIATGRFTAAGVTVVQGTSDGTLTISDGVGNPGSFRASTWYTVTGDAVIAPTGSNINCSSKNLTSVAALTATSGAFTQFSSSPSATTSSVYTQKIGTDVTNRFQILGDGTHYFTDGASGGKVAFFSPFPGGTFNGEFSLDQTTKFDAGGRLRCCQINSSNPSLGLLLTSAENIYINPTGSAVLASGKSITAVDIMALSGATGMTLGTTTGDITASPAGNFIVTKNFQALKTYTKVGTAYYPNAIVVYNIRAQTTMGIGTATYVNPSWAAGSFANNGDSLNISIVGAVANNSNSKNVQIFIQSLNLGTMALAPSTTSIADFRVEGEIWRASATTVDWNLRLVQAGSSSTGSTWTTYAVGRGQTVSSFATNALTVTVQSVTPIAASDITFNTCRITYNPAA